MHRRVLEDSLRRLFLMTSGIPDLMDSYSSSSPDRSACQNAGSRIIGLNSATREETGLTNCTVAVDTRGRAVAVIRGCLMRGCVPSCASRKTAGNRERDLLPFRRGSNLA